MIRKIKILDNFRQLICLLLLLFLGSVSFSREPTCINPVPLSGWEHVRILSGTVVSVAADTSEPPSIYVVEGTVLAIGDIPLHGIIEDAGFAAVILFSGQQDPTIDSIEYQPDGDVTLPGCTPLFANASHPLEGSGKPTLSIASLVAVTVPGSIVAFHSAILNKGYDFHLPFLSLLGFARNDLANGLASYHCNFARPPPLA